MSSENYYSAMIELKGIQSFLVGVPRLRAMVGANAAIGQIVRGAWNGVSFGVERESQEAQGEAAGARGGSLEGLASELRQTLPVLAVESGAVALDAKDAGGPWRLRKGDVRAFSKEMRDRNGDHPKEIYQDDPHAVALKTGVLSRDGGHFEALFRQEESARSFLGDATRLLRAALPGVLINVKLSQISGGTGSWCASDLHVPDAEADLGLAILDVPQSYVCELYGHGHAHVTQKLYRENGRVEETRRLSAGTQARLDWGSAFDRGDTWDVLGVLRNEFRRRVGAGSSTRTASRLEELAPNGYLAVVYADGNGIGKRSRAVTEKRGDYFSTWNERESFFYRLRTGIRAAFLDAVSVFAEGESTALVRPLMLGGDDLLLVCEASRALSFAARFADAVHEQTADVPLENGSAGPVSVGVGVAIVRASFPFHRAHRLAEELTESAKRISLDASGGGVSTVDWVVVTDSWHDDVMATRIRDSVVRDGEKSWALTAKPYVIREQQVPTPQKSLQHLLADADKLLLAWRDGGPARGQLKELGQAMGRRPIRGIVRGRGDAFESADAASGVGLRR